MGFVSTSALGLAGKGWAVLAQLQQTTPDYWGGTIGSAEVPGPKHILPPMTSEAGRRPLQARLATSGTPLKHAPRPDPTTGRRGAAGRTKASATNGANASGGGSGA